MSEWKIIRSRYAPTIWPILSYFDWDITNYFGATESEYTVHIWTNGDCNAIFDNIPRQDTINAIKQKLAKEDFSTLRQKGLDAGKHIIAELKSFTTTIESKSLKEIQKFLANFSKLHAPIMQHNMLYWVTLGKPIELEVQNELVANNYTPDQIQEIMQLLTKVTEESYSQKIDVRLGELYAIRDTDMFENEVKTFVSEYFWFPFEYVGPNIWTVEKVKELVLDHKHTKPISYDDIQSAQSTLIGKYKISESIQQKLHYLRFFTLLQDDRKMIMSHLSYYLNGVLLGELAKRFGCTHDEAHYIDSELLLEGMTHPNKLVAELKRRVKRCLMEQTRGDITFYSGDDVDTRIKELQLPIDDDVSQITEVKGKIACKGVVSGTARIVKLAQGTKIEKGDIIITGMTTPDFLPLLKKASAIVTDEGGITCHAAIVSRELSIPCIIGTKNATKVFKDGDLIEVDANTGVVRKL